MFTNIQYGSSTNTSAMDVCSVKEDCAWVIDGAVPLFPAHISDCASDGEWFVKEFNSFLKKHMALSYRSMEDLIKRGVQMIHQKYLKFPDAEKLFDLEMPCASCAIVQIQQDQLVYFVIGNCEVLVSFTSKQTKSFSDLRLQMLDAKLLQVCQELKVKQRMPMFQVRHFLNHMLVENRLRRNIAEGYYVLGEDCEAVSHALCGSIPLKDIASVSLVCNGFHQYVNCSRVRKHLDEYLKVKRSMEFVEIYDQMLVGKNGNEQMARYLQKELSGQSTVVCFDVLDSKQIGVHK